MILDIQNVSRRFGGLLALDQVSFTVNENEILGLIGPNGAGKTTLFNAVNGVFPPTDGRVIFRGADMTGKPPFALAQMGMSRTHQIVRPLNELTVRENVTVGACYGRANHGLDAGTKIADEVLGFVGLADRSEMLAAKLNVAQKKRLELARALAQKPILILLDEVLAGLNPQEVAGMVQVIRNVRAQGVTIMMIEHLMHAVMNLSDRVVVLDYGAKIAEGTPAQVSANERVIEAYLGDPKVAQKFLEGG